MAEEQTTVLVGDTLSPIEAISKYDPELRFRKLTGVTLKITIIMTQILSVFHIYTAGFGVLQEWRHRAFHLAFVLPLVYFYYSIRKPRTEKTISLVYDMIYGMIGSSIITAIFREVLKLTMIQSSLLALVS
ncbi:MAG: hypothetical protein OEW45_06410, partial [Deltaproteobacteria bacterium]|nr:hypothetical protein [Deltaproteobacteria bacterium]